MAGLQHLHFTRGAVRGVALEGAGMAAGPVSLACQPARQAPLNKAISLSLLHTTISPDVTPYWIKNVLPCLSPTSIELR